MRYLIYFLVFFAIAFGAFSIFKRNSDQGYSLSNIEENPIPKTIFFEMLKETAYTSCPNAQQDLNISSDECRSLVTERMENCTKVTSNAAPELIGKVTTGKCLHKAFLNCVTPFPFYNGVEVKISQPTQVSCV